MPKKRRYTKRSSFWKRKPEFLRIAVPTPSIEQEFCNLAIDYGLARTEQLLKQIRGVAHGTFR